MADAPAGDEPDDTDDPTRHSIGERIHDLGERIEEAAVEAEFRTGVHEDTVEEAKAHIALRLARMTLGFLTVLVGIILLPLPGPGWVIIAGGLVILSQDFVWAERTLRYVRSKVPGLPEDGSIPATRGSPWASSESAASPRRTGGMWSDDTGRRRPVSRLGTREGLGGGPG